MEAAKASLSPAMQVSVGECRYRDATASLKGDAAMSVVDEEYWDPDPHDLNEVFVVMEVCISRKGLERIGYEAVHLSNDEMHAIVSKLQKNIDIDLVRALLDSFITGHFRDCSRDTGLIQHVHDEVRRGFVDGLQLGPHATYPMQDAHGSALASAPDRHSFASCDSA